jgi:DNA polymerase I-like protein with 3'-5' exonuclease and polymerase domains
MPLFRSAVAFPSSAELHGSAQRHAIGLGGFRGGGGGGGSSSGRGGRGGGGASSSFTPLAARLGSGPPGRLHAAIAAGGVTGAASAERWLSHGSGAGAVAPSSSSAAQQAQQPPPWGPDADDDDVVVVVTSHGGGSGGGGGGHFPLPLVTPLQRPAGTSSSGPGGAMGGFASGTLPRPAYGVAPSRPSPPPPTSEARAAPLPRAVGLIRAAPAPAPAPVPRSTDALRLDLFDGELGVEGEELGGAGSRHAAHARGPSEWAWASRQAPPTASASSSSSHRLELEDEDEDVGGFDGQRGAPEAHPIHAAASAPPVHPLWRGSAGAGRPQHMTTTSAGPNFHHTTTAPLPQPPPARAPVAVAAAPSAPVSRGTKTGRSSASSASSSSAAAFPATASPSALVAMPSLFPTRGPSAVSTVEPGFCRAPWVRSKLKARTEWVLDPPPASVSAFLAGGGGGGGPSAAKRPMLSGAAAAPTGSRLLLPAASTSSSSPSFSSSSSVSTSAVATLSSLLRFFSPVDLGRGSDAFLQQLREASDEAGAGERAAAAEASSTAASVVQSPLVSQSAAGVVLSLTLTVIGARADPDDVIAVALWLRFRGVAGAVVGALYLLPLAPDEDLRAAYADVAARRAGGSAGGGGAAAAPAPAAAAAAAAAAPFPFPFLPHAERWRVLGQILSLPHLPKHLFEAKFALHALLRSPLLAGLRVRCLVDPAVACWLLSPDTVAVHGKPLPADLFGFHAPGAPAVDHVVAPAADGAAAPGPCPAATPPASLWALGALEPLDGAPGEPALRHMAAAYRVQQQTAAGTANGQLGIVLATLAALCDTLAVHLAVRSLDVAFREQEMRVAEPLVLMEGAGLACDGTVLTAIEGTVHTHLADLESRIRSYVPALHGGAAPFNLQSPKQVAELLYETLGLVPPHRNEAYNKSAPKGGVHRHASTDEATLESFGDSHPLPSLILQHRKAAKIDNTYLSNLRHNTVQSDPRDAPFLARVRGQGAGAGVGDAADEQQEGGAAGRPASPLVVLLPSGLGPRDLALGRIYTNLRTLQTATGRLSSADPNLQNIPSVEKGEGGELHSLLPAGVSVRGAFRSSGARCILVAFDYSQIEMRVLAHVSGDQQLLGVFRAGSAAAAQSALRGAASPSSSAGGGGGGGGGVGVGGGGGGSGGGATAAAVAASADIYALMAAQAFHIAASSVTPEQRKQAKTVVLGLVYGMGANDTGRKLGLSSNQAHELHGRFLASFPRLATYINSTAPAFARKYGHVVTLVGRRRLLPDILSPDGNKASYAHRQAVNTVIQGSAADIIKQAMILVDENVRGSADEEGPGAGAAAAASASSTPSSPSHPIRSPAPRLPGRLLLQIHDELLFEVPDNERDVAALVRGVTRIMTEEVPRRIEALANEWLFDKLRRLSRGGQLVGAEGASGTGAMEEYLRECAKLIGSTGRLKAALAVNAEAGRSWGSMTAVEGAGVE